MQNILKMFQSVKMSEQFVVYVLFVVSDSIQ